jgi:leader peptidase (prepilin peptidase)/N-methyltransferase
VDRHDQQGIGDRIASAWRAVGGPGQALTVVAAAVCVGIAVAWTGESGAVVACALSLFVLVVAALVDAVEHRLPNTLVLCAALPVVAAATLAGSADLARSAAIGAAVVGGPLLVTHLVTPSGMGFGDVKAGVVLGAAMGLIDVEVALLALVLGLGVGAAWGLGRRARSIALGPALVAGAMAAALIGAVS